jgi:dihydrofolate reductase
MTSRKISLIVALSRNGVIGRQNQLPWHLPDDLRHFKQLTVGKPVIMGRKTYDSIGKPLPNRRNIVISRQSHLAIPGCEVADSLATALQLTATEPEVMIIGGAQIFAESLPLATDLYLTEIAADIEGDVYFPEFDRTKWQEISRIYHSNDAQHAYAFDFVFYHRK